MVPVMGAHEMFAMNEAVRTVASPAGIWAVVIVAIAALAFWLTAITVVSRNPGGRRRKAPERYGPVLGGTHVSECGRSVAPSRQSDAVFADREADFYLGPRPAGEPAPGRTQARPAPAGRGPAPGANVTVIPGPRQAGPEAGEPEQAGQPQAPAMPAQRGGEADRPRRAAAGPGEG